MSLPFLKPKTIAGVIISHRKSDEDGSSKPDDMEGTNSALEAAAEDILRAISMKDSKHLALALQSAFDCLNPSEPSEYEQEQS